MSGFPNWHPNSGIRSAKTRFPSKFTRPILTNLLYNN